MEVDSCRQPYKTEKCPEMLLSQKRLRSCSCAGDQPGIALRYVARAEPERGEAEKVPCTTQYFPTRSMFSADEVELHHICHTG